MLKNGSFLRLFFCYTILLCYSLSFAKGKKDHIILILTDDQDVVLESMKAMPHTSRILGKQGAEFTNAFVTTPVCCPSRSSILTGMYVHNHHTKTNNANCSSPAWRHGPERLTFAKYLQDAGYITGFFGKYLNEYDGSYIPVGWDHWIGQVKNSRYYNYTLNRNGKLVKHGNRCQQDYFTDLIVRESIRFLKKTTEKYPKKPILMVLSMPAPHGTEDSAPQYQNRYARAKVPRTPNYNYHSFDKHWIVRIAPPMSSVKMNFTDLLYRKRLQTLLSVDDAVEKLYRSIRKLDLKEKTYLFFTSDHGYHLGHFSIVKGKSMPYETDIRVPFLVRGPMIPKNVKVGEIVSNIDLAPTFLDIAGVPIPSQMDGVSIMQLFRISRWKWSGKFPITTWRDTILIERGGKQKFVCVRDNQCMKVKKCSNGKKTNKDPICICDKQFLDAIINKLQDQQESVRKERSIAERYRRQITSPSRRSQDSTSWRLSFLNMLADYNKAVKRLNDIHRRLRLMLSINKNSLNYLKPTINGCLCEHEIDHANKLATDAVTKDISASGPNEDGDSALMTNRSDGYSGKSSCSRPPLTCFYQTKDHWKTPPYYTGNPFCACGNVNNNTYWCVRTINNTHNFLYCEFVTKFVEYFDLTKDPYQVNHIYYLICSYK
ncbi:uncharacterized protein TRIADDRAFT_18386 [Trichoplax adhaerens]|uniref:Sulfatase N-terminal domain-containing protein n=1 Tax=Trichoplax adhaerens TaxID=10228 RepID=B3RKF2_TRIAD|nr:hypothetical protein TRIADDRAFT_18386 [Trichoplax adhaerens]EDV29395.1 hypothetical protein TRIADDRAFT_18386 [Trichoplax adhaerens]|eukprot:XP_002108597.1 hypothetical protein TRIADDRAFT_18386 [Trichoplax adhaerens]